MNANIRAHWLLGILLVATNMLLATTAQAQERRLSIPAQPLDSALTTLALETDSEILFDASDVAGIGAPALDATLSLDSALATLLAGTDLRAVFIDADTVTLVQATEASAPEDNFVTDEIVVTARRFEEAVSDVPGSVVVVTEEEVQRSNIVDLFDYVERVPNLAIQEAGNPLDNDIALRGVSNFTGAAASGPVVGFFLDDVSLNPTGSTNALNLNLIDVERIEVLFGPQGTTFGRSTIAGAVNFVTKKPSVEREATLELQGGSFLDGRVKGALAGSLTGDKLLTARFTAFGDVSRGFIELPNQDDFNGENNFGARLALRSQPTDRLTLDLSGSFDRTVFDQTNAIAAETIDADPPQNFETIDSGSSVNRSLFVFDGNYDFDVGSLSSKTSLSRLSAEQLNGDDLELDLVTSSFTTSERSVAQEFKFEADGLQVPILGEVGFVAGVNFAFSEEDVTSNIDFGAAPLIASTTESVKDFGVFADLRFRPVEKLELGAGARFTRSAVELEGEQAPSLVELPGLPPIVIPGVTGTFEDTFTAITPRGSARYDWTDDFSTYVAISTGFRPGGFNPLGPSFGLGFKDERVINYEGGFRASFLDNRVDVSGTGFALFYDDIQITSVLAPGVVAIGNAGKARSIGSEISINARPLDGLSVGLGYGLALTRFTDFDDASVGGVTTDLTGERLPNAPVNTFRFTMDYAQPVLAERADAFLRVEHSYTSDAPVTDSATPFESGSEARNLVNLRTGFRAENWELEFFVENLFDARFRVGANATALPGVIAPEIGDTRRFGARGKIRF